MRVTFKLFASLARYLPPEAERNVLVLEVADGTTVQALVDRFQIPREAAHLVLVNGLYVEPGMRTTNVLADGDVLAVWPPVAGG